MKIIAISDMHGKLNGIKIPPCDLLLIAGDIAPWNGRYHSQQNWFVFKFLNWLNKVPAKHIVAIPGNHDYACKNNGTNYINSLLPKHVHLIHGQQVIIEGLKIWGTAWQPYFFDWAFNLPEDELAKKYKLIPNDTDILLTHCPPKGVCDLTIEAGRGPQGSEQLMLRLLEMQPGPIVNVCGHIHEGHGEGKIGNTKIYNVSVLDHKYDMVYPPTEIIL